jgi:DNA invertase Pin-like site-specific DNA recombinase
MENGRQSKPRTAIYARVSTSDQHCAQQLKELQEYVSSRGWPVQGEYVDHATSGKKDSRPALNRLLSAARKRQIDAVVCWKIDRWGRSLPHVVATLQELDSLGVRFLAITQGIDTDSGNPASRLLLNLLSAFADFEHTLIVERTKAGLQRARRAGRIGGRPRLLIDYERLYKLEEQGLTMVEIGEEMGISAASVCRALKRRRPPQPVVCP